MKILHLVVTTQGRVLCTISRPRPWTDSDGILHTKTLTVHNDIKDASFIRLVRILPEDQRIYKNEDYLSSVSKFD